MELIFKNKIFYFSFLLIYLFFIPFFIFAQTTSTEIYFCTDEYINLIYYKNDENTRSLYLTSFTNDNKIHIAESYNNDNRTEGDNPINIQSNARSRKNFDHALRTHQTIDNFSKIITNYKYNTSTFFGFLKPKDGVKITLRRALDNSLLTSQILRYQDKSKYIFVSNKQILGRRYGCGRGIKLIFEKLNAPPIINDIDFNYDLQRRELSIEMNVDEPLSLLSLKISSLRNNQLLFEYSSTTDGQQTSFTISVDLNLIPPQQRLVLEVMLKDLENVQTSKIIGFTTPRYRFNNPILNEVLTKEIIGNQAEIWVLTSRARDLYREINTESIINYGTSDNFNLTNRRIVNETCRFNNILFDCARHTLTNLLPNTQYNFYVTLRNDSGLVTTSTIGSLITASATLPIVSDLRANFVSETTTNTYKIIQISGMVIDNNPPINVKATLNNQNLPINFSNRRFDLMLRNIKISTTSELIISIKNNLELERNLRFLLPVLR